MTLKEQLIKAILENEFTYTVAELVRIQGGEPIFDIIERAAHNAITDNPTETEIGVLHEKAMYLMFFIDLGLVKETPGSHAKGNFKIGPTDFARNIAQTLQNFFYSA